MEDILDFVSDFVYVNAIIVCDLFIVTVSTLKMLKQLIRDCLSIGL